MNNSKKIAIIVLIVVAIIAGCVGFGVGISNKKKSRKNSVNSGNTSNTVATAKQENKSSSYDGKSTKKETKYEGSINKDGGYVIEHVDTEEENIIVPNTIKGATVVEIGSHAFSGEKSIKSIVLPDTVKDIDSYAFSECSSLEKIDLGKGVEYMGDLVFSYCSKLKTLSIPEGTKQIGALFCYCSDLKEVYIPASVTKITGFLLGSTCPNAVIVTPKGSAAEAHAIEKESNYRNN